MAIRYLLDTNICIYIAKHNPPAVRARFEQLSSDALAMSVVTLGELQHGAEKSQARDKALAGLQYSLKGKSDIQYAKIVHLSVSIVIFYILK